MEDSASVIKAAEAAISKGDYSSCIKTVEPLLLTFPAETRLGAQLLLLKVTAHIGRAEEKKAINILQLLVNNKEETIRQQSKQLLSILDAPSLPRPSNWSVEIPKIDLEPSLKSSFKKGRRRKGAPNYPPTGPTKNLDLGFSVITLFTIVLITFLLSGCVDISTNLSINDADRLKISLDIDSNSGKLIPWQLEFKENLAKENSVLKIQTNSNGQHVESPILHFKEANELLYLIGSTASKTSGFDINNPEIIIHNKNWVMGTRQNLKFYFDLTELPKIPGLKISISMKGIHNENNFKTQPLKPNFEKGFMMLPLQIGKINKLEVSYWKWNKISIGVLLIVFLTLLSQYLQKLRLKMGFGFPELPP